MNFEAFRQSIFDKPFINNLGQDGGLLKVIE